MTEIEITCNVCKSSIEICKLICEKCNPKWTPINEKLPDREIRVLVLLNGADCNHQIEIAELGLKHWYFGDEWSNEFASTLITHWMPLPEPPK